MATRGDGSSISEMDHDTFVETRDSLVCDIVQVRFVETFII